MKNLFKIISILLLAAMTFTSNAQLRTKTTSYLSQGDFIDLGVSPKDTLAVSDTIAYIIPVTHTNNIGFYQTFKWTKIGAGTVTMDVQVFQSNNSVDWFTVKKGVGQTDYTKTFTLAATGLGELDFKTDTAFVSGRYLKIQYKTSSTSTVQGSIATRIKSYFN